MEVKSYHNLMTMKHSQHHTCGQQYIQDSLIHNHIQVDNQIIQTSQFNCQSQIGHAILSVFLKLLYTPTPTNRKLDIYTFGLSVFKWSRYIWFYLRPVVEILLTLQPIAPKVSRYQSRLSSTNLSFGLYSRRL